MVNAIDLMKKDNVPFPGTVLNNFKREGYGYYSKYYYNYDVSNGKETKTHKVKT